MRSQRSEIIERLAAGELVTAEELSIAAGLQSVRRLRRYVHTGLVDRAIGATRGARFGRHHYLQLRQVVDALGAGRTFAELQAERGFEEPLPDGLRAVGVETNLKRVMLVPGMELVVNATARHSHRALYAEILKLAAKSRSKM